MAREIDRQKQLAKTGSSLTFNEILKLRQAREKEFTIQGLYKYGYRNKEDISNLPASTLVVGSQNVLTNAAEQVTTRNGYQLDGSAGNQNTYGIDSSYDFNTHTNGIRNLRKWGTALEVRYQNPVTQAISWINILNTLNAANVVNFASYWDTSTTSEVCLFVNGDNNVHRWTGGLGSFLSSTSSTITASGTTPLSQLNFDPTGSLLIDGITYAYTNAGVSSSTPYTENPTTAKVLITTALQFISQKFTTGSVASYISQVTAEVNYAATTALPVNFTCGIYTDNAGVPGTLIGSATTGTASVGGAGDSPISFTFNQGVTPNTNYHIVFSSDRTNNLVNFYIGASSGVGTNTSANGTVWNASNGFLFATVTESDIGSTTFSGVTPDPTAVTTLLATYNESNQNLFYDLFSGSQVGYGTAFTPQVFTKIIQSKFFLKKENGQSPVGNIVSKLYLADSTGTPLGIALATSNTVDVTTLTNSFALQTFTFAGANQYQMMLGVSYFISIEYSGTRGLEVGNNTALGGNSYYTFNGTSWISGNDFAIFYVYGAGISIGDAIIQPPSLGVALTTGVPQPFNISLIECLSNQVYYGSFANNTIYISKVNNYADCTFSTPRLPGEGANATIDAPPTGFKAQAQEMYISSGRSAWWRTVFTLSSDLTKESLQVNPLQTATNQGSQSQGLIGKLKNSIVFVSNETIINAFGPVKNILGDPNFVNMSDPIKYDIDAYNFAGGEVYYFNYFVYVTLPAMGIERLYNVVKKYWEAPQVVPFSRHYEVNGVLYAHSGLTNESYQCYVPGLYSDNGNPITPVIAFPYVSQEGGAANQLKSFNKHYLEGYLAANTTIFLTINYDFGGYTGIYMTTITGTEANIIFNKVTDGSIGQNSLGTEPIGSILNLPNQPAIPKFRIINTFPSVDCFEYQIVLSSDDYDQNWAILRSGPAVSASDNLPVKITI